MNKLLLKLSLLALGLCGIIEANAQNGLEANKDVLGARLSVDAPSPIAGVKDFTYSSNPALTSGSWGGSITTPVIHAQVAKAIDSLGCTTITGVSGKWALIYRGDCEFGAKALHAQQAGAVGVIIWNHTPNELINMAAGGSGGSVTIPVLFISKADGAAMNAQLNASNPVYISLTTWGYGKTHDLALVPASPALPPGGAIPITQFDGSDVPQYRGYTGAYVANTGTSTESNVTFRTTVTYTPTGGSPSVVNKDSIVQATFPVSDSIHYDLFSANSYKLTPTGIGKYDFDHVVYANDPDEYDADNSEHFTMYVTPNAFCRGRIDPTTQAPIVTGHLRLSSTTTNLTWGPLFYNHKGGYRMESLLFSVQDQDTSAHTLANINNGIIDLYVFKWTDGSNGAPNDGFMQAGELSLKGIAIHQFSNLDSNKTMLKAFIGDAVTGAPAHIVSDNDAYYWVAANLNTTFALSSDQNLNYHNRAVAASVYATNKVKDFWGPAYSNTESTLVQSPTDTVRMIPFNVLPAQSTTIDSASYTDTDGDIPAVSLITSVFTDKVDNTAPVSGDKFVVFPNPATDNITAKVDLLNKTNKLHIKVLDGFGRQVYSQTVENVQQKEVTISTKGFASGNYYMIMISDTNALSRPFTVIAK